MYYNKSNICRIADEKNLRKHSQFDISRVGTDALSGKRTGSCRLYEKRFEMKRLRYLLRIPLLHTNSGTSLFLLAACFHQKEVYIMKKFFTLRTMVFSSVLIALNIVITRLLSVDIGAVRIGLGFVPIALGSMLYGAVPGAVIAVIADILGAILQGKGYWLGFGLSAALMGITYGLFLYEKETSYKAISLCVILQAIFIDALLGALWYRIFGGMPFLGALAMRAIDAAVMIPVKIILIRYLWIYVGKRIAEKYL